METQNNKQIRNSFDLGLADKCIMCLWTLIFIGLIVKGC